MATTRFADLARLRLGAFPGYVYCHQARHEASWVVTWVLYSAHAISQEKLCYSTLLSDSIPESA